MGDFHGWASWRGSGILEELHLCVSGLGTRNGYGFVTNRSRVPIKSWLGKSVNELNALCTCTIRRSW